MGFEVSTTLRLRIQVFWNVMCVPRSVLPDIQKERSVSIFKGRGLLKMEALFSFEMLVNSNPITNSYIPEDLNHNK